MEEEAIEIGSGDEKIPLYHHLVIFKWPKLHVYHYATYFHISKIR